VPELLLVPEEDLPLKRLFLILLAMLPAQAISFAQTSVGEADAAKIIQQTQSPTVGSSPEVGKTVDPASIESPVGEPVTLKIPAGTPIEVEVAYTVSSIDVKPGELLSFRVLIPVTVGGVVAVEEGALVTARVTVAKRGGHWGKAGRLSWSMQDVMAVDNTRIPLAPETSVRNPDWLVLKPKTKKSNESATGQSSVKGTGHGGEIAARTIVAAAIFPPLAPLALMHGFKRGGNAVLPEGKRFVVVVRSESTINRSESTVTQKEKQ
jgi:hypothetical protein